MWYLIIPSLGTYFINQRVGWLLQLASFIQVGLIVYIKKLSSIEPMVLKSFSNMQINALIGWFGLSIVFTYFFNKIESYRLEYESILINRVKHDGNTAKLSLLGEMAGSILMKLIIPFK